MTSLLNELPDDAATSKKTPPVVKLSVLTGFDWYWNTLTVPTPVATVVVAPSMATAVPLGLVDRPWASARSLLNNPHSPRSAARAH